MTVAVMALDELNTQNGVSTVASTGGPSGLLPNGWRGEMPRDQPTVRLSTTWPSRRTHRLSAGCRRCR